MVKLYKVNLYEGITNNSIDQTEEFIGEAIVKKGIFFAMDIENGKRYKIVDDAYGYVEEESIQEYAEYEFEKVQEYINQNCDLNINYQETLYYEEPDQEEGEYPQFDIFVKKSEFTPKNRLSTAEVEEYLLELDERKNYKNNKLKRKIKRLFYK